MLSSADSTPQHVRRDHPKTTIEERSALTFDSSGDSGTEEIGDEIDEVDQPDDDEVQQPDEVWQPDGSDNLDQR